MFTANQQSLGCSTNTPKLFFKTVKPFSKRDVLVYVNRNEMTNILPIPNNKIAQMQQMVAASDVKLSDLVKMKAATLKSLVGCVREEEIKVPINVTK